MRENLHLLLTALYSRLTQSYSNLRLQIYQSPLATFDPLQKMYKREAVSKRTAHLVSVTIKDVDGTLFRVGGRGELSTL